jgi:hypothetical protein
MIKILRILFESFRINFFRFFNIKTPSLTIKEFPVDEYGGIAFFQYPFKENGDIKYFCQVYGENNSVDFTVAKRSYLKLVSEIIPGDIFTGLCKLNVSAGTLLPISIPNKQTDAAKANVTLTVNEKKYELGKLKQNSFHYIPFYNDSKVVVEAENLFILGSPIRFKHSQNNKKNKKLVMSIFIDGLASEAVNEKNLDDLMPNTAKYFSEGSIFFNSISAAEWTLPSVPVLFSGLYSINHMMCNAHEELTLGCGYEIISEYYKKNGYTTAQVCSNFRKSPGYNYMKGFDRTLYKNSMNCKESIFNTVEHLRAFSETSNYVWLTLFDLHDFLDGVPDISNQVESKIGLHDYKADTSKSVYQVFDNNMKSRYEIEMKRVDFYLKILFDYINENYVDDEVVLSICSDHGQSYLNDKDEILSEGRIVVPMMFKSSSTPKVVSDDMISNVDYLPTLLKLSGIKYDKEKIDGLIPEIFNGDKGRKYCVTESIYPNKHYYAAIYSKDEIFFLESKNKLGDSVSDIDLSKLEITGYKYITLSNDEKSRVKLDEGNLEKMLRILIARQRNTS